MPLSDLYYPELIGHAQIINAPPVIYWAWRMVRHMLSRAMQARVSITDRASSPRGLVALAPLEHLPSCWGGACSPIDREQYEWFLPRECSEDLRVVWDNNALAASLQQVLRRAPAAEGLPGSDGAGMSAGADPPASHPASLGSLLESWDSASDPDADAARAGVGEAHTSPLLPAVSRGGHASLTSPAVPAAEAPSTAGFGAEAPGEGLNGERVGRMGAGRAQSDDNDSCPMGGGVQLMKPVHVGPEAGSGAAQADNSGSGGDGVDVAEALRPVGAEWPMGAGGPAGTAEARRGRRRCSVCSPCARWCSIC